MSDPEGLTPRIDTSDHCLSRSREGGSRTAVEGLYPLRAGGAMMAEMAFHDYDAHPPAADAEKWVLCRVHSGKSAGSHFYKIVAGQMSSGRLELTCEYGGMQYPAA